MMQNEERFQATEAIKTAVTDLGLRQDWIAAQIEISPAFLSRLLRGERTTDRATAQRLCALLRLPFFVAWKLPISSKTHHIGSDNAKEETAA